jgi:hypothetical protein
MVFAKGVASLRRMIPEALDGADNGLSDFET